MKCEGVKFIGKSSRCRDEKRRKGEIEKRKKKDDIDDNWELRI